MFPPPPWMTWALTLAGVVTLLIIRGGDVLLERWVQISNCIQNGQNSLNCTWGSFCRELSIKVKRVKSDLERVEREEGQCGLQLATLNTSNLQVKHLSLEESVLQRAFQFGLWLCHDFLTPQQLKLDSLIFARLFLPTSKVLITKNQVKMKISINLHPYSLKHFLA